MKYLFIVQGEGRGHMTQAISLFDILTENGHEICHVVVGKSKRRTLPKFFEDQITVPITQLPSPNFATDKNNKSVKIFKTLFVNSRKIRTFFRSVGQIDAIVKEQKPDTIINFYDFLGGLYFLVKRPPCTHIALAHQFFLGHADFHFPKGRLLDRASLKFSNYWVGYKAEKILGLSFRRAPDEPTKKLYVVPPLLRKEIKQVPVKLADHFLVYMVNDGYSAQVEQFHKENPRITIHCFWDKKDMPEEYVADDKLTFHQLNDKKFIQYMASCSGYLTTAGFESVCEAMYMGKPVLMVPVKGHYEQSCNALDAIKSGAGISSDVFNLDKLLAYLPSHQDSTSLFHEWCAQTEDLFLKNLTNR